MWRDNTYKVTRSDAEAARVRVSVVDRVRLDHAAFGDESGGDAFADRLLALWLHLHARDVDGMTVATNCAVSHSANAIGDFAAHARTASRA